ncbi:MAG: T9SS type A sorting domain-containing protein [FCB group bacterium]
MIKSRKRLLILLIIYIFFINTKLVGGNDLIRSIGLGTLTGSDITSDGKKLVTCGGGGIFIWDIMKGDTICSIKNSTGFKPSIILSNDGSKIFNITNVNDSLKIWDIKTGTLLGNIILYKLGNFKISPNGNRLVLSIDTNLYVWDTNTGKLIKFIPDFGGITCFNFSPDGEKIVGNVLEPNKISIKIWDTNTGNILKTFNKNVGIIKSIIFSPDGSKIISTEGDGYNWVKVRNSDTGDTIFTFINMNPYFNFQYSPDGNLILTENNNHSIKILNAKNGYLIDTLNGHTGTVYSCFFTNDGNKIISGSYDSTIIVWDINTKKILRNQKVTGGYEYNRVLLSPDRTKIVDKVNDSISRLWDIITGKMITSIPFSQYGTAFNPDATKLKVISEDYGTRISIWDANTGDFINTFKVFTDPINEIIYSPDGSKIVSCSYNYITLWDSNTGSFLKTFIGHTNDITSISYCPDGIKIASGSRDSTIKIWDINTGIEILTLKGHTGIITSVSFSPDGKKLLSGSDDGILIIWEVSSGNILKTFSCSYNYIHSVCFSIDGGKIANISGDLINIWDTNTGKLLKTINTNKVGIKSICFNPVGNYLAGLSFDSTFIVWDFDTGKEINNLSSSNILNTCISFNPDGKILAIGGLGLLGSIINFWDFNKGVKFKTYSGYNSDIASICFNPDGRSIASGSDDGTIKIWKVPLIDSIYENISINVYPNPGSNAIYLTFQLPNSGNSILKLSDYLGREINKIDLGFLQKGENSYNLNVSELLPGVYFITIINGIYRESFKFLKE